MPKSLRKKKQQISYLDIPNKYLNWLGLQEKL